MKPTTFLVVLAATAASVVAAGYAVVSESRIQAPAAASGAPVFGDLLARANDVQSVTVASASGKFTIARKGDGWALAEKDGYPVAADKLRQLVAGLADLRLLEAKTDQPDRHARLEVEDIAAKDAKSKQVTLAGADGKLLADLIVGKQNNTSDFNGLRGIYVRKPGSAQAWLAQGSVEVPTAAVDWVDRTVVNVAEDKIQRLQFEPTAAPALTVSKADKTAADFTLAPLPEGKSADPDALKRLTEVFTAVELDDVRADKDTDKAVKAGAAEAATFDGLTLKAELLVMDGGTWLRLKASAAEGSAAAAEAKTINDRVAGWLYKLPQFKAALLQPKVDDFLKKPEG
jgi:Domain of unknown function (DUF4340)